jgi:hypothetical protein
VGPANLLDSGFKRQLPSTDIIGGDIGSLCALFQIIEKRRPFVSAPEMQGSEVRAADISVITLYGDDRDFMPNCK